jgi:hypothetical protein
MNINNKMNITNQEIEPVNASFINDDSLDQLIVKRTELADIIFFAEDKSNLKKEFCNFFQVFDLQNAFESSHFCITVIDNRNNSYVGLFIFNDTPFSFTKREGCTRTGGNWEDWFLTHYDDIKIDGKNALWLTFFYLPESYNIREDFQRRIFAKVLLSLYTTIPMISTVMLTLPKSLANELYRDLSDIENCDSAIAPIYSTKIMIGNNMFEYLPEIPNHTNELSCYINIREKVFPLIEIRIGTQEDHDDLENIFKDQTAPNIVNCYEDYFIAKMIADQDDDNKVLVGQVNDKAVGMLAISTDINVNLLVNSFNLEKYDNLLKKDYMNAVRYKRKLIKKARESQEEVSKKELLKRYQQEILISEIIPQRIYLQTQVIILNEKTEKPLIPELEELEKKNMTLTKQTVEDIIKKYILSDFNIVYPNLELFEGKIKIDEGTCLLQDKFHMYIETLEFFGLPKNYMNLEGHWTDWLQREADKRAAKEAIKKKYNQNSQKRKVNTKKDNLEVNKPTHFDLSPLIKALKLFTRATLTTRSTIRKLVEENKKLIASFFVNENNEPCETKCFDIMSLARKLMKNGVHVPEETADIVGQTLLCFGNLPFDKKSVMRVPEEEIRVVDPKKDAKNKKAKKTDKKQEVKEEIKKELVPVPTIVYEVSISDFFKSIDTMFKYDKLLYELGKINSDTFSQEYDSYMKLCEDEESQNNKQQISEFNQLKDETEEKNSQESHEDFQKYANILENYNDETAIPPTPPEVLNAFCVKLFFMEQAFESRSSDFLIHAFDCFQSKDYLVITQPHTYYENALLEHFIKVEKKIDSLFSDMIYIVHREALLNSLIKLKYTSHEELVNSFYLFESLGNNAETTFNICKEAIKSKESKFICVTAKINDNIIGIFLLSKEANIAYYDSHFNIRDYSNIDKIMKYYHSRILYFQVHKNFTQYNKLILKELMRLTNKINLYYEISPDVKTYPIIMKDLVLAKNRRFPSFIEKTIDYGHELYESEKIKSHTDFEERDEYDGFEADFCLAMTSKRMLADAKLANNNRIVIVGGSDTGISFIESLLSIRYLDFSHIYLIAPGGLLYHHIEDEILNLRVSMNNYQITELKKLLLEHRIKIINMRVKDIMPSSKFIQLEDNSILNYDYLILTLGLQDKLWTDLRNIVNKQLDEMFIVAKEDIVSTNVKDLNNLINTFNNLKKQLNVVSVDDPNLYSIFAPGEKLMNSLRKNPKFEIILYGRNLNLITFIQGLIKRNIPAHKIKVIIPNIYAHAVNKEEKTNYKKDQLLLEEISFSNSTSFEGTPELENFIIGNLTKLGVKIYQNYNFIGVNISENRDAIVSYRFLEEGSDKFEDLTASIIVTGGLIDVDQTVFKFIHENKLVYNGRAIIKQNFMTANEYIFAAGRLCEFSQKFVYTDKGRLIKLERYISINIKL